VNRKAIIVALILSLLVSVVLWKKLQSNAQQGPHFVEPPIVPMVSVVKAIRRIPVRTRLEAGLIKESVKLEEIVASLSPPGAFTNIASLTNRFTGTTIFPGDVLTPDRLLNEDTLPSFARLIPDGKRAVSLTVTKDKAVGGFIQQGDFVDVVATFRPPKGDMTTKVVLQDLLVLAVGGTYQFDETMASSTPSIAAAKMDLVTLAVTPQDLERLMYLDSNISNIAFRLVLKSPRDKDRVVQTSGANERKLLESVGLTETGLPLPQPTPPVAQPVTPETPPKIVPTVQQTVIPAVSLVVRPMDDGKVEVRYGSSRKFDLFKDNAPVQAAGGSSSDMAAPSIPPQTHSTSQGGGEGSAPSSSPLTRE